MRPTLRRKASFLSSSKAALPGGLRHSGEAAGQGLEQAAVDGAHVVGHALVVSRAFANRLQ